MNDRKSTEELLSDINYDLLQFAEELRKNGFTSTMSTWYLAEQDLHSPLNVRESLQQWTFLAMRQPF